MLYIFDVFDHCHSVLGYPGLTLPCLDGHVAAHGAQGYRCNARHFYCGSGDYFRALLAEDEFFSREGVP